MSRAAVVVNLCAGGGKAGRIWPDVARRLESRLGPVAVNFTEAAGHATELARRLLRDGFDRIIAAGGDGTVNEVANGFFDGGEPLRPEARLGILPVGTGSDLGRTLRIPRRIADAVDLLAADTAARIDVGRVVFRRRGGGTADRLFVNIASFGLGAEAAARVSRSSGPSYLIAVVAAFRQHRPWTVRLTLDSLAEPLSLDIADVAIGNGRFQAGGMQVCPRASLTDGLLEVTVIEPVTWPDLLGDARLLYTGGIYRHPKVTHFRATRIAADSDAGAPLELDGEPVGTLPAEFTVLTGCLPVVC